MLLINLWLPNVWLLLIDFIIVKSVNTKSKFYNTCSYKTARILLIRKWFEFLLLENDVNLELPRIDQYPHRVSSVKFEIWMFFWFTTSFIYISHSTSICTVVIKNIKRCVLFWPIRSQIFCILAIIESKCCQHCILNLAQMFQLW